jgi:hypothetical protein
MGGGSAPGADGGDRRRDAVTKIARRCRKFVDIFENVRAQTRAA